MTTLGIDLNDAGIVVADGHGDPVFSPGYAVSDGRLLAIGADAWQIARLHPQRTNNRFWRELSDDPLTRPLDGEHSAADLAHAQLEQLCAPHRGRLDGAVFVVPPHWSNAQLGLLLGIADDVSVPVQGLVDSAVAATRREYSGCELLHVDASLHALTIARMDQDGRSSVRDRRELERIGVDALERHCIEYIARQFVERTRFDPLHDGRTEQYLYRNIYAWLNELSRRDELTLTVEHGGNEFDATLRRTDIAASVAAFVDPVVQNIRGLVSSEAAVALQVTARLTAFPGFVEAMERIPRASVFGLDPGATALGACERSRGLARTDGGIRLTASLPWDQPAIAVEDEQEGQGDPQPAVDLRPTHVLFESRAYRLDRRDFNIGSELAPGDYGVCLDAGVGGVSRRHCSIRPGPNGVELVDHSRFGTHLNGHPVEGAAILQCGDLVSVGVPQRDFALISEVDAGAGSARE